MQIRGEYILKPDEIYLIHLFHKQPCLSACVSHQKIHWVSKGLWEVPPPKSHDSVGHIRGGAGVTLPYPTKSDLSTGLPQRGRGRERGEYLTRPARKHLQGLPSPSLDHYHQFLFSLSSPSACSLIAAHHVRSLTPQPAFRCLAPR